MLGKAGHCYFVNEAVVEPREAYKQSIFFHIKGRWHHHKSANGRDLGTEFGSGTNLGARHVRILLFRKVRSQPKLSSFFVDDDGDGLVLWCGHPIADGNHQRLSHPQQTHIISAFVDNARTCFVLRLWTCLSPLTGVCTASNYGDGVGERVQEQLAFAGGPKSPSPFALGAVAARMIPKSCGSPAG